MSSPCYVQVLEDRLIRKMQSDIDELVEFSATTSWKPQYPRPLVRRFLTELISNKNLIFDFHDHQGRLAAAVLLDKVNNPANDACLEILGMRADAEPSAMMSQFIALARDSIPKDRAGFQVGLSEGYSIGEDLLRGYGLQHYYDTFEMRHSTLIYNAANIRSEISQATAHDRDQIYSVLCESFAQTPDTSIPDAQTWKSGFLTSMRSHFYTWREAAKILGFAALIQDDDGKETEIRTIGVLPHSRGQGIGQHLLSHCLNESAKLGVRSCRLTVAVTNQKALGLYLKAGFKPIEKHKCYRMTVMPSKPTGTLRKE